MPHVRKQIRDFIVAVLKGQTAAGQEIYAHRLRTLDASRLPAIGVATTDERSDIYRHDDDGCGKGYRRTLNITVDLYATGDRADDQADALAEQVEALMERDETFGGRVRDMALVSSADIYSEDGERMAGRKRLTYSTVYRTRAGDASQTI